MKTEGTLSPDMSTLAADPAFERRSAVVRGVAIGATALAGLSVLASSLVVTLPPWVLFLAFVLGIGISATATHYGDRIRHGAIFFGVIFYPGLMVLWSVTGGEQYPFLSWWWSVLSASIFGMLLVVTPQMKKLMLRTIACRWTERERIMLFQARGDSALTARMRHEAVKTGVIPLTLILLTAAGLEIFGLYYAIGGDAWGLALALMWLVPVGLLLWQLRLLRGGRRMLETDDETAQ